MRPFMGPTLLHAQTATANNKEFSPGGAMNRFWLLFLVFSISAVSFAGEVAEEAAAAYKAKDWAKAQALYSKLTVEKPDHSLAWYRLGESRRQQRHFGEALTAFEKARQLGFQPIYTLSRIALVQAEMGSTEKAVAVLEQLAEQQAPSTMVFDGAPAFARLAGNPRFEAVKRKLEINSTPCKFADVVPEARQFDFWVGEWEVFNLQGIQSGINKIERILGDCVILENWTDRFGSQGKSFNKYNREKKRWEQYWVDEQGSTIHFWGQLEGKNMVFHAEAPQPDGKMGERKLVFYNLGPNKLRQFSQITADGGKTWSTEYDLTYIRRGSNDETADKR
jgi:tetratricopeptide (TPR) repeat protein